MEVSLVYLSAICHGASFGIEMVWQHNFSHKAKLEDHRKELENVALYNGSS